ncbi:hypothetical protein RIF29_21662 [Crotalaria pallida]|uniref:Uncharacterized protein n=1 Tax=Crotalaria pallida TaxID=3830 RepID=A0AAN9F736_CROPI
MLEMRREPKRRDDGAWWRWGYHWEEGRKNKLDDDDRDCHLKKANSKRIGENQREEMMELGGDGVTTVEEGRNKKLDDDGDCHLKKAKSKRMGNGF